MRQLIMMMKKGIHNIILMIAILIFDICFNKFNIRQRNIIKSF